MTRRTLGAIVSAVVVAVVLFALPLAFEVARLDRVQAVLVLERDASRAALQVPDNFASTDDPVELPTGQTARIGLYRPDTSLHAGDGPDTADPPTRAALDGRVTDVDTGTSIVLAVPVTANEQVIGAIRVATPTGPIRTGTVTTWLAMAALAAVAVAVAAVIGWRLALRLAAPVDQLADAATRLGKGDFTNRAPPSDIPELDQAADALNDTAQRLEQVLARERAFSADASHQLATPLTRLRLSLELAQGGTDTRGHLDTALHQADLLERTIDDLLTLARDDHGPRQPLPIQPLLDRLRDTWHGALAAQGRPLRIIVDPDLPDPVTSAAAAQQILQVLVDNAATHGRGPVHVHARATTSSVAIDITNSTGRVLDDTVFQRRSPQAAGSGIGLALAKSLAEAEGGRLVLTAPGHDPTFTLLLPTD